MLNFAAFRYRAIMAVAGGPIERLEISDTTVLGQREFLASAFLREGLGDDGIRFETCSAASGSGTAPSPMVARFMALSEALERWAHWQLHPSAAGIPYGFGIDPSSNGMAAYPGLWRRQARTGALMEASERFNLLNWWEGHLPAAETAPVLDRFDAAPRDGILQQFDVLRARHAVMSRFHDRTVAFFEAEL